MQQMQKGVSMIDKKDLKSQHDAIEHIDKFVINPYPRATEAKFNQNTVESVLFGNKKEDGDDNNGKFSS